MSLLSSHSVNLFLLSYPFWDCSKLEHRSFISNWFKINDDWTSMGLYNFLEYSYSAALLLKMAKNYEVIESEIILLFPMADLKWYLLF